MKEKKQLELGQLVDDMTEEERKAFRMSIDPDDMGFDGMEGMEEDEDNQ